MIKTKLQLLQICYKMFVILKNFTKSICLISIPILVGCNALKRSKVVDETNNVNQFVEPKIIFLSYQVTKKIDETIKIDLTNKIIVEGNLKKNSQKQVLNSNDNFVCVQFNKSLSPIDSLQLSNPFIKNVEYVDELGMFVKQRIELDTSELFLRMKLNPLTKFISLKTMNPQKSSPLIIEL